MGIATRAGKFFPTNVNGVQLSCRVAFPLWVVLKECPQRFVINKYAHKLLEPFANVHALAVTTHQASGSKFKRAYRPTVD